MKSFKKIFPSLTRNERIVLLIAFFGIAVSAAGLGGLLLNKYTKPVPAVGGELTEGVIGQPVYLNPVLASNDADWALVRLIFANLGDIAQKMEVDKSGRSWDVRLKENLLWSDGKKITSDDIVFTVERMQDPESQSPLFVSWQGVTVERISELELRLNLVTPYSFFSENLKNLYIIPKHIFADTPAAHWQLSDYNLRPVSSGPYEFDSLEKQSNGFINSYRLKINDNYSGKSPFISHISLKFFSNKDDLINSFNAGAVDSIGDFDPGSLKDIKRPYKITQFNIPSYYAIFLNTSQANIFADANVRKSLTLSVDKSKLIDSALQGYGRRIDGPVIFPDNRSNSTQTADLSLAASLLDNAGWKMGADGVREKTANKNVQKLQFDIAVPQAQFLTDTARFIREAWAEIGIKANIVTFPTQNAAQGIIKNREYQAILFGNILHPNFDLYPFWHSSERFYPGLNLALYNEKQADTLIETIRRNFDSDSRNNQLEQLQSVIESDYPAVFLFSPDYLYVTRKDLNGVTGGFIGEPPDRFLGITNWYLKTARVFK